MQHDIQAFHPKHWNDDGSWTWADDALFLMFSLVILIAALGLVVGVITDTSIGLVAGGIIAPILTIFQSIMMRTHEMHNVGEQHRGVIGMIDSLPPEYRAEFGSDYKKRILTLSADSMDLRALDFSVGRVYQKYLDLNEMRAKHEAGSEQLLESVKRINNHISDERKALTQ